MSDIAQDLGGVVRLLEKATPVRSSPSARRGRRECAVTWALLAWVLRWCRFPARA